MPTRATRLFPPPARNTDLRGNRAAVLLRGAGFGQLAGQLSQLMRDTMMPGQLGITTDKVRFSETLGGSAGQCAAGYSAGRTRRGTLAAPSAPSRN
ncbi:hypothetical protein [Streptomyces sp. NBC_00344]|uniref:hypothetical protein n=1 Tax=Streptomyces sp. NBC_00344 TaxID=2975720 RepID=UPI002E1DEFF0